MRLRTVLRTTLQSVEHDEQLSVVAHLDELRTRLIVALAVIGVAFGLCFWQNNRLLAFVNAPLARQTEKQVRAGNGPLGATYRVQESARDIALQLRTVIAVLDHQRESPPVRASLREASGSLARDAAHLSAPPQGDRPVTLGIGEPFTTTATVALVFALILSLPILLLQIYGFLMPALDREQRRRVRPLLLAVPLLFLAGVAFGYLVVLPAAIRFLQNFNSAQFNVLVQASPYYTFAATTLLAMGVLFQVPVAILAITRAGVMTPRQLRRSRRYAIAASAAVAAFLPGDLITMLLEAAPLYILFEASVLVASVVERRERRTQRAGGPASASGNLP